MDSRFRGNDGAEMRLLRISQKSLSLSPQFCARVRCKTKDWPNSPTTRRNKPMIFPPSKENPPPSDARATWRVILRAAKLAGGRWRLVPLTFAASVALAGLWLVPPILLGVIIDTAIPRDDARLLAILALSIGVVGLCIALADALETYCQLLLGHGIERAVRVKMFESVQNQSHRFFVHNDVGAISSRLWSDVSGISAAARTALAEVLSSLVTLAVTVGFMLAWDWRLALALLCVLPPVFAASFWMGRLNQKAVGTLFRKHEEALSLMFERLNINGFTLLNGLGYDKRRDLRRFDAINKDIAAASTRQGMAVGAAAIILSVFWYSLNALASIQTVPEPHHRKRPDQHVQPLAVPVSPMDQAVQPHPQFRVQPLVSVHLAPLSLYVANQRQDAVRLVVVAPVQRRLRQPPKQPKERLGVPVSNLEVRPPTAVPLLNHRRPDPHGPALLPPPHSQVRPHLIE